MSYYFYRTTNFMSLQKNTRPRPAPLEARAKTSVKKQKPDSRLLTGPASNGVKKKYLIKTKYGDFQVLIWYDKNDKSYLVETVGFDRTMTFGVSIAEAKRMAKELIELLVECALEDGNVVVDSTMRVVGRKIKPESVLQLQRA